MQRSTVLCLTSFLAVLRLNFGVNPPRLLIFMSIILFRNSIASYLPQQFLAQYFHRASRSVFLGWPAGLGRFVWTSCDRVWFAKVSAQPCRPLLELLVRPLFHLHRTCFAFERQCASYVIINSNMNFTSWQNFDRQILSGACTHVKVFHWAKHNLTLFSQLIICGPESLRALLFYFFEWKWQVIYSSGPAPGQNNYARKLIGLRICQSQRAWREGYRCPPRRIWN